MTEEIKKCAMCGNELAANAKKCKLCGERVNNDDFPHELRRFNWGAFLLNWIWGVMHKKYITLLVVPAGLIPILGPLALSIWFGVEGNRWAWEYKDWSSIEEFNESQKMWVRLWLVLFIYATILILNAFIILSLIVASGV